VKHVVDDWIYGEMRYGRKLDGADQTIKVICRLDVSFHTFINAFFFAKSIQCCFYINHLSIVSCCYTIYRKPTTKNKRCLSCKNLQ
jgi:hypothetical protein